MSALAIPMATLPATPAAMLEKVTELQEMLIGHEPVEVPTEHVLWGDMYARTIIMPEGYVLIGALVKVPTLVIVVGSAAVLAGEERIELEGYNVVQGCAGRKQMFVSRTPLIITMLFPTKAKTVEEAEEELTDDAARLLSRRQNANRVVITEE